MKRFKKEIDGSTVIKTRNQIVIERDGMNIYNPTEEMILADGWEEYVPPTPEPVEPTPPTKSPYEIMQEIVFSQYNERTDISDAEALDHAVVIYHWGKYIGKALKAGQCVVYEDKVIRVRQDITQVLDIYPPSKDTAAMYETIVLTATGTEDDPIPYTPPMEIFEGKYYKENGFKYLCTRSSGTALSHELSTLVGIYVGLV